jgi:hypothetical protein
MKSPAIDQRLFQIIILAIKLPSAETSGIAIYGSSSMGSHPGEFQPKNRAIAFTLAHHPASATQYY